MAAVPDNVPHVAVVGAGYWGKNLVRTFSQLKALHTICEPKPQLRTELAAQYPDCAIAESLDQVIDDPRIRSVAIATPAETHGKMVRRALVSGKDVFVEKPLCLSVEEGAELVALARARGRILMVGHLLWYHPAVLRLKELVESGELGRIQYIYSNRLNLGKFRREENILWSFAPHDISVILGLLDEMPDSVEAQGGNYLHQQIADVTVSLLSFPSGVKAHVFVSWLHPFKEQKLVVVGDRKMAVFDDVDTQHKLRLYPHTIQWENNLPVANKAEAEAVDFTWSEPLREECLHFLQCTGSRVPPRTDGEEAVRVLTVLHQCEQALHGRHPSRDTGSPAASRETASYSAHASAFIDDGVTIGRGTRIWHVSHVMKGSRVGRDCRIGQNVVIGPNVTVGDGVKIQNNVSVYEGVTLEDHVFCGPSVVFTNVLNPRSAVPRMHELRPTLVRTGATLGANCTIVCGTTIGQYAFVGAGAVVTKDVPDHALVVGSPAKVVGWMCQCGVKIEFDDRGEAACDCGKKYHQAGGRVAEQAERDAVPQTACPRVPLLDLAAQHAPLRCEIEAAISRVLDSNRFILGPEVSRLEERVAHYCQSEHAIAVSSGTDALLMALMALNIGQGDEVITTPYSFFATAGAIARLGATPVFVDIHPETYNIDPGKIERAITSRTKVILPVHLFGQCAEMEPILALAEAYQLRVIEDAAQAIGAEYRNGKRAGSMGDLGCFSFFPSKNLGCLGDGGLVVTQDAELAERLRVLRSQGGKPKYVHQVVGGNFRLDAIQAAVLNVKLDHLEAWTRQRQRNADRYTALLSRLDGDRHRGIQLPRPVFRECGTHNYHIYNQFVIRTARRDGLREWLLGKQIETEVYYPLPLHLQQCFAALGYREGDFPEAEAAAAESLALPIFAELTDEQATSVASATVAYFARLASLRPALARMRPAKQAHSSPK